MDNKENNAIESYSIVGGDIQSIQVLREKENKEEDNPIFSKITEVIYTYYNGKKERKWINNEKSAVVKVLREVNFNKEVLKILELAIDGFYNAEPCYNFDTEPVYNPWVEIRNRLLEGAITLKDVEEITTLINRRTIFREFDFKDYIRAGRAKGLRIIKEGANSMPFGKVNVQSNIKRIKNRELISKGEVYYFDNGLREIYLIVSIVGYVDGEDIYNLYDVEDGSLWYEEGETIEKMTKMIRDSKYKLIKNSKVIIEGEME